MEKEFIIGIDIGGTNIKSVMIDTSGHLSKINTCSTAVLFGPSSPADQLIETITDMAAADLPKLKGVGIAVPGIVSEDQIPEKCVNLKALEGVDIRSAISERLSVPVSVNNDLDAAVYYINNNGPAGLRKYCVVGMGTGIGSSVVVNRESIGPGSGEIGHITVDFSDNAKLCTCGSRGCLEQYASPAAIENEAYAMGMTGENGRRLTASDIIEMADRGNAAAAEIVDKASRYIGRVLSYMNRIIAPEKIFLTGAVFGNTDSFFSRILSGYTELSSGLGQAELRIVENTLFCTAIGAALSVLEKSEL